MKIFLININFNIIEIYAIYKIFDKDILIDTFNNFINNL